MSLQMDLIEGNAEGEKDLWQTHLPLIWQNVLEGDSNCLFSPVMSSKWTKTSLWKGPKMGNLRAIWSGFFYSQSRLGSFSGGFAKKGRVLETRVLLRPAKLQKLKFFLNSQKFPPSKNRPFLPTMSCLLYKTWINGVKTSLYFLIVFPLSLEGLFWNKRGPLPCPASTTPYECAF